MRVNQSEETLHLSQHWRQVERAVVIPRCWLSWRDKIREEKSTGLLPPCRKPSQEEINLALYRFTAHVADLERLGALGAGAVAAEERDIPRILEANGANARLLHPLDLQPQLRHLAEVHRVRLNVTTLKKITAIYFKYPYHSNVTIYILGFFTFLTIYFVKNFDICLTNAKLLFGIYIIM